LFLSWLRKRPENCHEWQEEHGAGTVYEREAKDESEEGGAVVGAEDLRGPVPEGGQQDGGDRADDEEAVDGVSLSQPSGGDPS
jgi:hypothetical protein